MNISKTFLACAAVCATLGIPVTAYSIQLSETEDIILQTSDQTEEDFAAVNNSIQDVETVSVENDESLAEKYTDLVEEEIVVEPNLNVPSENDEIVNDIYFLHTFSDGTVARIPFKRGTDVDVDVLKRLGSDTPFKNEICYEVVEFLDGTKRYFKEELPEEFPKMKNDLEYGFITYFEGGTGEYYEEAPGKDGIIGGWR